MNRSLITAVLAVAALSSGAASAQPEDDKGRGREAHGGAQPQGGGNGKGADGGQRGQGNSRGGPAQQQPAPQRQAPAPQSAPQRQAPPAQAVQRPAAQAQPGPARGNERPGRQQQEPQRQAPVQAQAVQRPNVQAQSAPPRVAQRQASVSNPPDRAGGPQSFGRDGRSGGQYVYRGQPHQAFQGPSFSYPSGWGYRRWSTGQSLPFLFLNSTFFFDSYATYGFGPPPRGYRWVRYGPDLLLVSRRTGRIREVIYGVFY